MLKRSVPLSLSTLIPFNNNNRYDLYSDVFCRNKKSANGVGCVAVKDSWGFGLKSIAKALHKNNAIATSWPNSNMDGMAANIAAIWCHTEAKRRDVTMLDLFGGEELHSLPENVVDVHSEGNLMKEIESYNYVDCRVMYEIVDWGLNKT